MTQILSGVITQKVRFLAPTGLAAVLRVSFAKAGDAWAYMTTPTITEDDPTLRPGAYTLLVDEGTTITPGMTTEELALYIDAPAGYGMNPVGKFITLYLNLVVNAEQINATDVIGDGSSGDKWRG